MNSSRGNDRRSDVTAEMSDANSCSFVSSRMYLTFIENSAAIGTWSFEPGQNSLILSDTAKVLLGLNKSFSTQDLDISEILKNVDAADRDNILSGIGLMSAGVSHSFSFRFKKNNCDVRWLYVSATATLTSQGTLESVYGFIQDSTEQRRAVKAVEENERRSRQLADHGNFCLWISKEPTLIDPKSEILNFSTDKPSLFKQELLPQDKLVAEQSLSEAKRHSRPVAVDVRFANYSSTNLTKKIFITPIKDREGLIQEWHCASFIVQRESLKTPLLAAINGRHLRAARALLDWSVGALETKSSVSKSTIRRAERTGLATVGPRSAHAIKAAFTEAGVTFGQIENGDVSICDRIGR